MWSWLDEFPAQDHGYQAIAVTDEALSESEVHHDYPIVDCVLT